MGEGAGVVVLEDYEHAKKRGARIYAEVVGYGLTGDGFHITSPDETGDGGERAMRTALQRSGLDASEIDYVNAHGTSTPAGDEIEVRAVERVLGNAAATTHLSSTKSAIGHLLGAAGSVEAIFCVLAIRDGVIPPTLNLDNPSFETPINLTPHKAVKKTGAGCSFQLVRLRGNQRSPGAEGGELIGCCRREVRRSSSWVRSSALLFLLLAVGARRRLVLWPAPLYEAGPGNG